MTCNVFGGTLSVTQSINQLVWAHKAWTSWQIYSVVHSSNTKVGRKHDAMVCSTRWSFTL